MNSIVSLMVFSVVIATVCSAPWEDDTEEGAALTAPWEEDEGEGEALTAQDFYEYFEVENMAFTNQADDATLVEKRARRKAGRK